MTFGRDSTEGRLWDTELTGAAWQTTITRPDAQSGYGQVEPLSGLKQRLTGRPLCRQADDPALAAHTKGSDARTLSLQGLLPCSGRHREPHRVLAEGLQRAGVKASVLVTNTTGQTVEETIGGVPVVKDGAPDQCVVGPGQPALLLLGAQAGSGCRHRPCAHAVPAGRGGALVGRAQRGALSSPITAILCASACWVRSTGPFFGRCCARRG